MKVRLVLKGGPGSGHFGHVGRPGKVGGSSSGSASSGSFPSSLTAKWKELDAIYTQLHDTGFDSAPLPANVERQLQREYDGKSQEFAKAIDTWVRDTLESNDLTLYRTSSATGIGSEHYSDGVFTALLPELANKYANFFNASIDTFSLPRGSRVWTDYGKGKTGNVADIAKLRVDGYDAILRPQYAEMILLGNPIPVYKGGPGSGNFGHAGRPGKVGGSSSGGTGPNYLPPEQRVWQGKQVEGKVNFNQNETGRRGEVIAAKALQDKYGVEFSLLNDGLNNAPIDVAGDHHAIEVKTGPSTNGYSAQQWRITTSYTSGPTERDLIAKMSKQERSAYNKYKQEQSISRKYEAVTKMSEMAGAEIKPATVGVVLSADGRRGDVYMIPDFHLRLSWGKYATDEYYLGTYEVGDESKEDVLKGGAGSGHWGHVGRPGIVGGSLAGLGGLEVFGLTGESSLEQRRFAAALLKKNRAEVRTLLEEVTQDLGYEGRVVYGGEGYTFKVDGQQYKAAASYDPRTDVIALYEGSMSLDKRHVNEGILVHEITHSKFHKFQALVDDRRSEYVARLIQERDDNLPVRDSFVFMDGTPRSEADKKRYAPMLFRDRLNELDRGILYEARKMPPTKYAKSYWDAAEASGWQRAWTDRAINESFAEVARLRHESLKVHANWTALYEEFVEVME